MGENLADPQVNNLNWINVIIMLISIIDFVKDYSQVKCPECGEDVADKDKLPMHLKSVHNYSKPFLCDQPCDKSFATKYNLVAHQSRRTCLKNYQIECQFCGDKFGTLVGLREGFKNPSNGNFSLRGGVPPFSVNFFPLTFSPAVVR